MKLKPLIIYVLLVIIHITGTIVTAQNIKKLYPFPNGDKYGLVDSKKRLVADYIYDYISPFRDGVAIVGRDKKYGLVSCTGKEIVTVNFDSLIYSYEGLYIAERKDSANIIDTLGNFALPEWYPRISDGANQIFMLKKQVRNAEEYIRKTILHYHLEEVIGLDRDSVLTGTFLYGYYSKQHPALNGIWFSGGSNFDLRYADVAISKHTFKIDTLGNLTPRIPDPCDFALMCVYIPDEPPIFPGGAKAFQQFVHENLKYPDGVKSMYHKARVKVRLRIDETGHVEPFIIKSLSPDFDDAVIKAMMKMPKWTPAKCKGKPVCCFFDYSPFFYIPGL